VYRRFKIKATLSENVNKLFRLESKLKNVFVPKINVLKTPIIINNFNRLEWLAQQVDWLQGLGLKNIHIIDNASTYTPLLEYYKKVKANVYILDKNIGHEALWKTHLFQRFCNNYYVYTDPDVLPYAETKSDFMFYFYDVLQRYPEIKKVGFGLGYIDIPDYYIKKQEVQTWEKQFYINKVEDGLFKSKIDTTFALYRPGASYQCWEETLRSSEPYLLKHMPWYENSNDLPQESRYYLQAASEASSWYSMLKP
jgi:hypothetical protein